MHVAACLSARRSSSGSSASQPTSAIPAAAAAGGAAVGSVGTVGAGAAEVSAPQRRPRFVDGKMHLSESLRTADLLSGLVSVRSCVRFHSFTFSTVCLLVDPICHTVLMLFLSRVL